MSVFDDFLQRIGAALTDIRHRVVEEPYFGRIVTDGPEAGPTVIPDPTEGIAIALDAHLQRLHSSDATPADRDRQPPGIDLDRG